MLATEIENVLNHIAYRHRAENGFVLCIGGDGSGVINAIEPRKQQDEVLYEFDSLIQLIGEYGDSALTQAVETS